MEKTKPVVRRLNLEKNWNNEKLPMMRQTLHSRNLSTLGTRRDLIDRLTPSDKQREVVTS